MLKIYLPIVTILCCIAHSYSNIIFHDSSMTIFFNEPKKDDSLKIKEQVKLIKKIFMWTNIICSSQINEEKLHNIKVNRAFALDAYDYWIPGFFSIIIDNDLIIRRIHISEREFSLNMTKNEIEFYEKTKRIPSSYIKISESAAIETAQFLISNIFTEKNKKISLSEFDSVNISYGKNYYQCNFYCKQKTDVYDKRYAEIKIEASTGEIIWYTGDLFLDRDLNYKPVISKGEAIKIVDNIVKKMNKKITYKSIHIIKDKFRDNRMVWDICIKEDATNAAYGNQILIDCENGKILLNDLMP